MWPQNQEIGPKCSYKTPVKTSEGLELGPPVFSSGPVGISHTSVKYHPEEMSGGVLRESQPK